METITRTDDRFEIAVDGETVGEARFLDRDGRRIFFHTEVDDEHSGQGLARRLVEHALDATRGAGLRVVPVCPYVERLVGRTDRWSDVVETPTPEEREAVRGLVPSS